MTGAGCLEGLSGLANGWRWARRPSGLGEWRALGARIVGLANGWRWARRPAGPVMPRAGSPPHRMGAERNDAKAWLPANPESTKALDVQSHFQSPNIFPAVVVYERASGLTAADRAKAAADAGSFAGVPGVSASPGHVVGPIAAA